MDFWEKLYSLAGDSARRNEPMRFHTTFRAGGPADFYVTPADAGMLLKVVSLCREQGMTYLVIGNGSNLLCTDAGFRGVIIDTTKGLNHCERTGRRLVAGTGALLGNVAKKAMQAGLSGLEFAAGIPGSVGGATVMNAGAYGGEMSQVIEWVRVLDADGHEREIPAGQMDFSYRHSIVEPGGFIVLEAGFALEEKDREQVRAHMDLLAEKRREKQPVEYPSAGSTFKRPVGGFASKLIDEAGLKGLTVGGAQVSEKHAGFVINRGGATAADILELCGVVRGKVKERTGIDLEMEVKVIGER